jgi:hypothetical protein
VAPLSAALTTPKGRSQEETVVVKPSPVIPKKNSGAPPLKRQRKAAAVAASLGVHQPSSSSDHVSIASCNLLCLFLNYEILTQFVLYSL